jgi:TPR repeat protein
LAGVILLFSVNILGALLTGGSCMPVCISQAMIGKVMRTRLKIVFAVLLLGAQFPAQAGNKEGMNAMQQGQFSKAFREWRPLAEQGKVEVQAAIAVMYHTGRGVKRDFREALKWYRKAAEQGYAAAQVNLGVMYEKGIGTRQDGVLAYAWYDLAASHAQDKRQPGGHDKLAETLPAKQLAKAKRLAREYRQKYVAEPVR